jgi:hypothetical protein
LRSRLKLNKVLGGTEKVKTPKAPAAGDPTKVGRRTKNKLLLRALKAKVGRGPKVSTKGLKRPRPTAAQVEVPAAVPLSTSL